MVIADSCFLNKTKDRIFIPAGNLKMNWVDAQDIGLVGASVFTEFSKYQKSMLEITGSEFLDFNDVAGIL